MNLLNFPGLQVSVSDVCYIQNAMLIDVISKILIFFEFIPVKGQTVKFSSLITLFMITSCFANNPDMGKVPVYKVVRLQEPMEIDSNWDKPQWEKAEEIEINNFLIIKPQFCPTVKAKLMYDNNYIYVIFRVNDRFVRCIWQEINDPVYEDSCVEFFFSPDIDFPERYFNLEINCGGTPLMRYNIVPRKETFLLDVDDIKKVEIAHSLPNKIDPEITDSVTWTIEYKIPFAMLEKYSNITYPQPGTTWRANFYKIAENNSNPHYMTWAVIYNDVPDFHLPQFFGKLEFK